MTDFSVYIDRFKRTVESGILSARKSASIVSSHHCTSAPCLIGLSKTGEDEIPTTYSSSPDIIVKGDDVPRPILNFSDIDWPQEVKSVIEKKQLKFPTPIQCQTVPIILENRDLIGIAQTGSGKTLAYIMPTVVKMLNSQPDHPNATSLVVAPTRELVKQIYDVAYDFPSIRSVCVYGGTHRSSQLDELRRTRPRMIIATPGRLIDYILSEAVTIGQVSTVIIDEADRMLDMGFEDQLRQIFSHLPKERQTLMWSATWPMEVQSLASDFLNEPVHVTIGSSELYANPNIKQEIKFVEPSSKDGELLLLLKQLQESKSGRMPKTLIFSETKRQADIICAALRNRGYKCESIHGNHTQNRRDRVLHQFKQSNDKQLSSRQIDILVATDVAARGLDVRDIEVVINYDFPNTCETYIHRIGRTARGDLPGSAYSFFTRDDCALAQDLTTVLQQADQPVDPMLQRLAEYARQTKAMKRQQKRSRNDFFQGNQRYRQSSSSPGASRPYSRRW